MMKLTESVLAALAVRDPDHMKKIVVPPEREICKGDVVWFLGKNQTVVMSGVYSGGPYGEYYGVRETETGKEYLLLVSEMYPDRDALVQGS